MLWHFFHRNSNFANHCVESILLVSYTTYSPPLQSNPLLWFLLRVGVITSHSYFSIPCKRAYHPVLMVRIQRERVFCPFVLPATILLGYLNVILPPSMRLPKMLMHPTTHPLCACSFLYFFHSFPAVSVSLGKYHLEIGRGHQKLLCQSLHQLVFRKGCPSVSFAHQFRCHLVEALRSTFLPLYVIELILIHSHIHWVREGLAVV